MTATWLKLASGFDENLKVAGLSDEGFRLAVTGMCYCSRNLTDGVVPASVARRLVPDADPGELVDAGLWVTVMSRRDAGVTHYEIHDYLAWNRSREQVHGERVKAAERQKSRRNRHKHAEPSRRDMGVTHGEVLVPDTDTDTDSYTSLVEKAPVIRGGRFFDEAAEADERAAS